MNVAFIRWAGMLAAIFGLALIAQLAAGIVADISDDSTAEMLRDIDDNRELFLLDAIWSMGNKVLFVPVIVALFLVFRNEERPWFAVAGILFLAGTLLLVASAAMSIPLADAAMDYVDASEAERSTRLESGETLAITSAALGFGGVAALGLAILITGVLMLGSVTFPRWLAFVAIAMAVLAGVGFLGFAVEEIGILFLAVFALQIVWLLGVGWTMWRMGQPLDVP